MIEVSLGANNMILLLKFKSKPSSARSVSMSSVKSALPDTLSTLRSSIRITKGCSRSALNVRPRSLPSPQASQMWWLPSGVRRTANPGGGTKINATVGRDHWGHCYSALLAGGGVRGGQVYGATDDFGYRAVADRCGTADLHATMLHLLGLDYKRVFYKHWSFIR